MQLNHRAIFFGRWLPKPKKKKNDQTPTEKRWFFRILGIPRSAPFLPCASVHYKFPTDCRTIVPFVSENRGTAFGLASRPGVIVTGSSRYGGSFAESFLDDAFEVSLVVCFSSFSLPVFQLIQLWPCYLSSLRLSLCSRLILVLFLELS